MRMKPADLRLVHLALADAASGTPRQWWHLEIAAALPAKDAPSPLGRMMAAVATPMLPVLDLLDLPGLSPYRPAPSPHTDALAAPATALGLLAALAAVGSLNASRELGLILLALLGAMAAGWRAYRAADAQARLTRTAQAETAQALTPSESALGLAALLIAAGHDYDSAQQTAARWLRAPDAAPRDELARLGLLAPRGSLLLGLRAALAWILAVVAIGWPCWLLVSDWQLLPASLGVVLVHFVGAGHMPGWWRRAVRSIAIAAGAGLLAWLRRHR